MASSGMLRSAINAAEHQRHRRQQDDELVLQRKIYDARSMVSNVDVPADVAVGEDVGAATSSSGAGMSVMPQIGHLPG